MLRPLPTSRALAAGALLLCSAPVRVAFAQCPDGSLPPCGGRPARTSGPAATSVAVLYFDNLSRDTGDSYLAEGLTEQTIAQLGEVERLTVTSRFAVRRFRGGEVQDPAAVGRALNVAYLVTGSVQRAGTRLRVGVELMRASSGVRVWGERYDRTAGDLLRLQDDIASAVATGIMGRLLPAERSGLAVRGTRDAAAWDHFLRGNFQMARRDPPSVRLAIAAYQAAVQADPVFTEAMARIAYAYGLALDNEYDIGLPRDTLIARGVTVAERALRLDSTASDAWMARAYIRMAEEPRTLDGVRERFERAIRLDPRNAEARHQYASYLGYWGDTAAAERENRRVLELEPGRAITWFQLADLALRRREAAEALRFADSALAADPGFASAHIMRGIAALSLGDTAEARRSAQVLSGRADYAPMTGFIESLLDAGPRPDSQAWVRILAPFAGVTPSPTQPGTVIGSGGLALYLARFGATEPALGLLAAARPRGARLHDFMRWPWFDPVRADPRFQALWNESRPTGSPW